MENMELAKAIALHLGIKGKLGGWIYRNDRPVCQGWFAWLQICKRRGWIVNREAPFDPHINWRKVPNWWETVIQY